MPPFLIPFLGPLVDKLVDLIPDPAARAKAKLEAEQQLVTQQDDMIKAFLASDQAQAATNTAEAQSGSLFDKWRDFIGWTCGAAFAWQYVLQPIATFILTECHHAVALPAVDFSSMSTVLMGMLGLAGMHMYQSTQK